MHLITAYFEVFEVVWLEYVVRAGHNNHFYHVTALNKHLASILGEQLVEVLRVSTVRYMEGGEDWNLTELHSHALVSVVAVQVEAVELLELVLEQFIVYGAILPFLFFVHSTNLLAYVIDSFMAHCVVLDGFFHDGQRLKEGDASVQVLVHVLHCIEALVAVDAVVVEFDVRVEEDAVPHIGLFAQRLAFVVVNLQPQYVGRHEKHVH